MPVLNFPRVRFKVSPDEMKFDMSQKHKSI